MLALQQSLSSVIARVQPCVVAISRAPTTDKTPDNSPFGAFAVLPPGFGPNSRDEYQPSGTGVVIDPKGLILTQYLNVRPGEQHRITTTDGQQLKASIKGADPRSGLAVLEVSGKQLAALPMGDADGLQKGFFVVTLGNPEAIIDSGEPSASWGTVTNLAQRATASTNLNNTQSESDLSYATSLLHLSTLIQTDAKLNWTYGGGAVVDLSGRLVGITTQAGTLPGHESPAGYAIPMNAAFRRIVDDLKAGREVEYGMLGLSLIESSTAQNRGAVVSNIVRGSAADIAGLRPSDRVVEIDGKSITDVADLQLKVSTLPPGKPVKVQLVRNGQGMETEVSLSKLFVPGEKVVTSGERWWRGMRVDYSTALPRQLLDQSQIDPEGCVAIVEVTPGSSADSAGIKPGMFVSHVATQRVSTPDEFYAAVADSEETLYLKFTGADTSKAGENIPAQPSE